MPNSDGGAITLDGNMQDAGGGSRDGGGGSSCSCTPIDTFPMVSCTIGATRCTGCLGFDDFCDDMPTCAAECPSEFTCVSGIVMLGTFTIASCVDCTPGSCPGICSYVCVP